MQTLKERALENHRQGNSCSYSVLEAFSLKTGLSRQETKRLAEPLARGKMGKCGALLAAETILEILYDQKASEKITELEQKFLDTGKGSLYCKDLVGSCRSCVADAAGILEEILKEEKEFGSA